MKLSDILQLLLGLAMFLYGMNLMGSALEKRAGRKLKQMLSKLAANPFRGFLLGAAVTGIIQSSCATTVMVVGFVNSGIMTLAQSVGIIIGANVGTSITGWILSLSGVTGSTWYITIFKPDTFTPVLGFIGVVILMFAKSPKKKDTAGILLGFAVLMTGMSTMSAAVKPLSQVESFTNLLLMFSNPFLGVLVGMVFTMIIQSSSASVGILQALSASVAIQYSSIFPLLFGFNIGTCITALISSSGTGADAKRASIIHLSFNILSALVMVPVFYIINSIVHFEFSSMAANTFGIALLNTAIKVVSAIVFLPISGIFLKIAHLIVKDGKESREKLMLDERLFVTPSVAIDKAREVTLTMAEVVSESFSRSITLLDHYDEANAMKVSEDEDRADKFEDMLGTYLVKLGEQQLSIEDSHEQTELLHVIGDFERISDHARDICESATELHEKKMTFTDTAISELTVLISAVAETLRLAVKAFTDDDLESAARVEPLEQVVDSLQKRIRTNHIDRLTKGICSIEHGFVLNDLLGHFERISDHCSNIAGCVIETHQNAMAVHSYLGDRKSGSDIEFNKLFKEYYSKYSLQETENQ